MKKSVKIWLAAAGICLLLGLGLMAWAMTLLHWDFTALDTDPPVTRTHEIGDQFRSISVNTDTADIIFAPSADGSCRLVCAEREGQKHTAAVKNGTLEIRENDARTWRDHISFFTFGETQITLYLPAGEYARLFIEESTGDITIPADFAFETVEIGVSTGDVSMAAAVSGDMKITADTGDIRVTGASPKALALSVTSGTVCAEGVDCSGGMILRVTTGKAQLRDVRCEDLYSVGDTGDLFMENVIAAGTMSIERTTGEVRFESCDAPEITVIVDTGDVSGSLCSDKVFLVTTNTGDVRVPSTASGGICEITTDTGDVNIQIQ